MPDEPLQHPAQLLALVVGQGRQQVGFRSLGGVPGTHQPAAAQGCQRHDVTAQVVWVTYPSQQTVGLEQVEQAHEVARVDPQRLPELLL